MVKRFVDADNFHISSMLVKTRAIVFRKLKYGDSGLIVDLYTEELGLRSYLVQGVRKPGDKGRAALFQLSSLLDIVAYQQEGKSLQRVKEFQLSSPYQTLLFDVVKSTTALFLIDISRKVIKEKESNPYLFNFLSDWFLFLDKPENKATQVPWVFILQLSSFIGFEPNGQYSEETPYFDLQEGCFCENSPRHAFYLEPAQARWISEALHATKEDICQWTVPKVMRKDLLEKLLLYYQLHVEDFKGLQSADIISAIL
ncbi:MAG: DNA repair protein RecO [Saprospiraceae bacterium]